MFRYVSYLNYSIDDMHLSSGKSRSLSFFYMMVESSTITMCRPCVDPNPRVKYSGQYFL